MTAPATGTPSTGTPPAGAFAVPATPSSAHAAVPSGFPVRAEHLASQVALVAAKSQGRVVGVRATGPWAGGDAIEAHGTRWVVAVCPSGLAVREALAAHERAGAADPEARLVVLTGVGEDALGWDVLARLAKGRLVELAPWDVLLDLFRARDVDPRVAREAWLAEVLLAHTPAGGWPPAPSGLLDAETAWAHALDVLLALPTGRPDAVDLLAWSADPASPARWARLPEAAREPVRRRLTDTAGWLAPLFAAALDAGAGQALLPIGLACEVLFPPGAPPTGDLARAAVRLEPMLGGLVLEPDDGRRWFAAARRALDRLEAGDGGPTAKRLLHQAEALLGEWRAEAHVAESTVLPAGHAARRAAFGRALAAWMGGTGGLAAVGAARARMAEHRDAAHEPERAERLLMAERLARWLEAGAGEGGRGGTSLGAAAQGYLADASWADWARTLLLGGEPDQRLAEPLAALRARTREARERGNHRFAAALAEWSRLPNGEPGLVPVECLLDDVVALVAARAPVLVLLVDGMDWVVWRQLQRDVRRAGWETWMPGGVAAERWAGVAVVPSVTGFSRASLFAGRLTAGAGADEARAFAVHPALLAVSRPRRAPALFHKGALSADGALGLSAEARERLQDPEQRVVGAVLNAVDDYLAKSDQVRPLWSADRIALFEQLLFEADLAGRAVVVVSDHGHVLEAGTEQLSGGEDERWRPFAEPVRDGEVVMEGPRVQGATGLPRVVVPWSEGVRYTRRKAGYHGGATPQEVVVPVAVLARGDRPLDGWRVVGDAPPAWWGESAAPATPELAPRVPVRAPEPARLPGRAGRAPAQPNLFADGVAPAPAPSARVAPAGTAYGLPNAAPNASPNAADAWVDRLLASPVYAAQRALAGRLAPPDAQVRAVLGLLAERHGRAPRAAVAQVLGMPEFRVRGPLAGLQRLLNVDGYPVFTVEEGPGTVAVQRAMLLAQFGIDRAST